MHLLCPNLKKKVGLKSVWALINAISEGERQGEIKKKHNKKQRKKKKRNKKKEKRADKDESQKLMYGSESRVSGCM